MQTYVRYARADEGREGSANSQGGGAKKVEVPVKHEMSETTKAVFDALSVVTVLGTIVDMLPSIAAIFTIVWTGIRIWETDTVRKLTRRDGRALDE